MTTSASLFSGGGLWDIGAMQAGFTPVWGVEIRPDIAVWAERNIPDFYVVRADVAEVDYSALPKVEHLHASPSCKNASDANAKGEEGPGDISSARAICEAIRQQRPKTFTLENVWPYRKFPVSFPLILACLSELGYQYAYWRLCSADYGVPQERYRLILIARLDRKPAKPQATHYKPDAKKSLKGMRSLFWQPWVGWYQAIEDLLPTLPPTEPAPWQLARMPEEYRTMPLAQGSYDGEVVNRGEDEPAFTITANSNQGGPKAFLASRNGEYSTGFEGDRPVPTVTTQSGGRLRAFIMPGGGNTNFAEAYPGRGVRYEDEPAQTVTTVTSGGGSMPRAFIVDGQGAGKPNGGITIRREDEPMFAVTDQGKGYSRAFVVGSQYAQPNTSKERYVQIRNEDEPYFTVTVSGGAHSDQRRYVGHWVSITPRCLARFQSVPDFYTLPDVNGLACEIVGNGVACLLAQRICESLR